MSFLHCPSCVVVLQQQQEQNIAHQQECQDIPSESSNTTGKNSTVVENGRVVVKPLPPKNQTQQQSEPIG